MKQITALATVMSVDTHPLLLGLQICSVTKDIRVKVPREAGDKFQVPAVLLLGKY